MKVTNSADNKIIYVILTERDLTKLINELGRAPRTGTVIVRQHGNIRVIVSVA